MRLSHKYLLYKLTVQLVILAHHENNKKVLTLLEGVPGLDFRVVAVGLLREISSVVGKGFGEESRFASVIEAEKAGLLLWAAVEEVTDSMVCENWKHLKVLIGAALVL